MTIENSNDYAMQLMETSNKNIKELFTNSAEDEPEDLSSVIAQSTPMIKNPDMDNNKPVQSGGVVQLGEPEEFTNMRDRIQKFKDMRKNGGGDVKETFETTDTPLSMDELKKMEEEEIETFENKYFSPLLSDVNKPKRGGNDVESFEDSKKVFSSII
jgi:hypothetical protein